MNVHYKYIQHITVSGTPAEKDAMIDWVYSKGYHVISCGPKIIGYIAKLNTIIG